MPANVPLRSPAAAWRHGWLAGRAPRRALAFAGLAALVMALHGALLHDSAGALGRHLRRPVDAPQPVRMVLAAQPAAAAVPAVETVAAPVAQVVAPAAVSVAAPAARAVPSPSPSPQPAGQKPAPRARLPAGVGTRNEAAAEPTLDTPPQPALAAPAASTLLAQAPQPPETATATATATAPLAASAPAEPAPTAGSLPPVYATETPINRTLDYRVQRGSAVGVGQLRWESTPSSYTLSLQASAAGGPALDWLSRGGFDSAGLAPQRMVERQRQREVHAVNFQRDKNIISFSGPSRVEPLLRGAQDRLSWLIQLASVAQAQRETIREGDVLRFQVASPRGDVDEWSFTAGAITPVEAAGTRWGALKLVREPQRPYDQRVEVWLAPGASYLPIGLKLTTVPGGVPLELWLSGGLQLAL